MNITVVVREPGRVAEAREIELSGKALRAIVGGYVEIVLQVNGLFPDGSKLTIYANEDGRAFRQSPSVIVHPDRDPILGPIVCTKTDASGDETTLAGDELQRVLKVVDSFATAPATDN